MKQIRQLRNKRLMYYNYILKLILPTKMSNINFKNSTSNYPEITFQMNANI